MDGYEFLTIGVVAEEVYSTRFGKGTARGSAPRQCGTRVTGIAGDAQLVGGARYKPGGHAVAAGEGERRSDGAVTCAEVAWTGSIAIPYFIWGEIISYRMVLLMLAIPPVSIQYPAIPVNHFPPKAQVRKLVQR